MAAYPLADGWQPGPTKNSPQSLIVTSTKVRAWRCAADAAEIGIEGSFRGCAHRFEVPQWITSDQALEDALTQVRFESEQDPCLAIEDRAEAVHHPWRIVEKDREDGDPRAREPIDQVLELEQSLFRPVASDAEIGHTDVEHALKRCRIGVVVRHVAALGIRIARHYDDGILRRSVAVPANASSIVAVGDLLAEA